MTGPALLEKSGAQSKKQTAWAPIFIETLWPGLVTNRNVLHSWGTGVENAYGLSRPGVLIGGLNTEVTVRNTMGRRPGNSLFSTVTYPTPPARSFAFQLLNGTIQVLVDTSSTGSLSVTSVAASTGTSPNITAVFTGVFPNGGSNAYAGLIFTISGFTNTNNNGSWVATASTTTTLTLTGLTTATTVESAAASAVSTGAVYVDNQNGTKTLLFAKSPGAGQTAFIGEAGIAYFGDGVDTRKYTPGNPNGTIWNWGIVAPTQGPTITITESASASTPWQANTVFSTMGLVIDSVNNVVYQLQNINYSGTNNTRFATTGTGQPVWNQNPGGTTADNGQNWTNFGPIVLWTANTEYNPASPSGGTFPNPCAVYDPITKAVYLNGNESGPGRSGATVPKFIPSVGKGVKDGTITWFYMGPGPFPNTWLPAHVYPALSGATDSTGSVVEPNSLANGLLASPPASPTFWQVTLGGLTSAASATSPFTAATAPAGQTASDGTNIVWLSLGSDTWTAGQTMTPWTASGVPFSCIVDPLTMNFFVCTAGGVAGGTVPVFNPGYGAITPDGTGVWTCVGTSIGMTWAAGVIWNLPVQGFAPPTQFQPDGGSSVVDNNSTPDLEFVINSGISGSSQPTWSTTPTPAAFPNTADTVSAASHAITAVAVSTGIATYTGTFPANNTINGQTILIAGFSTAGNNGLFNILVNTTTTITVTATTQVNQSGATATGKVDLIWVNVGTFTQNALVTTVGRAYAYSYKARALDDFYSVESLTTNANGTQTDSIPIPPGLSVQLPAPTGSETGAVSSASPATVIGANTGAVNTVTGLYSSDPQVDTIVIWRSPDEASGSDDMVELTEIPNIVNTTGTPQFWQFQDYLPDIPTTTANGTVFPGLNTLIPAPIDGVNNPPPSDFLPMAYNYTRIWGSVGQAIDFSGGPDTPVGNPNENFNAADEFPFLSNVIRAVKSTVGLVVFTTASIEIILGGPQTSSFYSVTLAPGIGLGNFNALDIYAGEIYFIDATGQLRTLLPNLSVTSAGFAITDQLVEMNPATVYVAFNEQPNDTALYFGTGATPFNGKTGWFRMNPHQTPGGFQGPEPVWSPFAAITNGCQMLQSIEVSPGVHKLLTGSTLANQSILERNLSVFTDNGTSYDANFQVGSLMLCLRGEIALLKFIESDFALVTTNPTVSYLLDEISGVFSPFTLTPIFDPPSLYGTQLSPLSYNPLRYYFNGTGNLARCVNMQIGIDFGTTANADECFNLSVYGAIVKNG